MSHKKIPNDLKSSSPLGEAAKYIAAAPHLAALASSLSKVSAQALEREIADRITELKDYINRKDINRQKPSQ